MNAALAIRETRTRALAETTAIEVVKDGHDKLSALRLYAEKTKDREKLGEAIEWLMRHEIRAGEILGDLKSQGVLDQGKGGDRKSRSRPDTVKLADLGITKSQSSRWQDLARLPAEEQATRIEMAKEKAFAIIAKSVGKKRTDAELKKRRVPPLDAASWNAANDEQRQQFYDDIEPTFLRSITDAQRRRIFAVLTGQPPAARPNGGQRVTTQQLATDIGAAS